MKLMDGRPCLRSVALLVPMAAVLVTCGCAVRSGAALSGRFIKQGEPKIRIESPMPAPGQGELHDYTRKVRELQSRAVAKSSLLPTIEGRDKALGAALVRLTLQESAENHRLVAAAYRQA